MISFLNRRTTYLIGLVALLFPLPGTFGNVYTVSDDRIRSLDVTPTLGRGYSIMTNTFQTTCLVVTGQTVPSYNYKYEFHDFIDNSKYEIFETKETVTQTVTKIQKDTTIKKIHKKLQYSLSSRWVTHAYTKWKYSWNFFHRKWTRKAAGTGYYRRLHTKRVSKLVPYTVTTNYQDSSVDDQTVVTTQIPTVFVDDDKKKHMVVATMRIERYYSSIRDDKSSLSEDALTLLDAEDYIGFFKGCGPNFVRGIRRVQEVTAIFKFKSDTVAKGKDFANLLKGEGGGALNATDHKYSFSTLQIEIKGYGLGLPAIDGGSSEEGNLLATNLEEYQKAMKYAFRAMTQGAQSGDTGQVYGIEVIPWTDNIVFQVAARIDDAVIQVPMPRRLIPNATSVDPNIIFVNDPETRLSFRCKDPAFQIDKYGNCCEESSLYNHTTREYDNDEPSRKVCRPTRNLEKPMVKNNVIANAEFVSRLDNAVRYKMNELSVLQQCISAARAIPSSNNYNILRSVVPTVESDTVIDYGFSVLELKLTLDPFNDFGMVRHMAKELDEFTEMFYSPCLAALFGTNIGTNPNTDPSYFLAYPWHSHEECLHLSCLAQGVRWDRDNGGGCVPGLLKGTSAKAYADDSNSTQNKYCSKDPDLSSDTEKCKHNSTLLATFQTRSKNCWDGIIPSGQVSYFLEHYCMPAISPMKLDAGSQIQIAINQVEGCGQSWDDFARSDIFTLTQELTRMTLVTKNDICDDGVEALVTLATDISSTVGHFEYMFKSKTIVRTGCDKVLTLDSCDTTAGRVTMEAYDATLKQKWTVDGGQFVSVDCATDTETYFIASKATAKPKVFEVGVVTDGDADEALFSVKWLFDDEIF